MRSVSALLGCLLATAVPVVPAVAQGTLADYERAALFQNADSLVSRMTLEPNWISGSDSFWYVDRYQGAKTFMFVDPARNIQRPAFDHVQLAATLSRVTGKPHSATALPFDKIAYRSDMEIAFAVDAGGWRCSMRTYDCVATPSPQRPNEIVSPDGRRAVFVRNHNLWVRDTLTDRETALTTDGTELDSYAELDPLATVTTRMLEDPVMPLASFSPDSRKLLAARSDARKVRELGVAQAIPGAAPRVQSYRSPIAGDTELFKTQMVVVDLDKGASVPLRYGPFDRISPLETFTCWNPASTVACFTEDGRGYKSATLHLADAATGEVRTALSEQSDTYIDRGRAAEILGDGGDVIWASDRDGWAHLYRIDARTGRMRNPITRGEWAVRGLVHVDQKLGRVFFTAGGREPDRDPYYRHLYSIGIDGKALKLLTPEDADHIVSVSPTGRYFVDTYSRIDKVPVSVLRGADGRLVRELQHGDIARLQAAGWRAPEPFKVKAGDGKTDLFGAIFRPSNFDPSRRYPVLDAIYPGPQSIRTRKSFPQQSWEKNEQAIAELGFIVVTLDGRGTPHRSRAFRELSFGNLGSAGGLDDHVVGLKQLAARYPYMDLDRVGIYGHSGGGYASTRALLKYPDFYKVAVSSSGNHDQRSYYAGWGERFEGYPVGSNFEGQANPALAANLKGKLLLVHGEMDDNVHPSGTMQMVDALIAANKDFDLLILPNRNHVMIDLGKGKSAAQIFDPYFLRRRWDYFVQHLLGVTPPDEFQLRQVKAQP